MDASFSFQIQLETKVFIAMLMYSQKLKTLQSNWTIIATIATFLPL